MTKFTRILHNGEIKHGTIETFEPIEASISTEIRKTISDESAGTPEQQPLQLTDTSLIPV